MNKPIFKTIFSLAMALVVMLSFVPMFQGTPVAHAQTTTLTLSVVSADKRDVAPGGPVSKGDPVLEYKYLINVDNTV